MKPTFTYEHKNFDGSFHEIRYAGYFVDKVLCIDIQEWLANIGFLDTTLDINDTMREKYPNEYSEMIEILKTQFHFTDEGKQEAKSDEDLSYSRNEAV